MKKLCLGILAFAFILPACGGEEVADENEFSFNADEEFAKYDSDNDGQISTGEWLAMEGDGPTFGTLDEDGDLQINEDEFGGLEVIREERHNAENEDSTCELGIRICSTAGVFECTSDGTLVPVESCGSMMECVDGICQEGGSVVPSVVLSDYPPAPYGTYVGAISENAQFVDPNTGDAFKIGQHYGEKGHLALIAANGW